jgi:7-cyano-7-deazaguanine reductase
MTTPEQSQLGKAVTYPDNYDPGLLFPMARAPKRAEIGLAASLPFFGADLWTAYELSWLTPRGKPQVAIAHVIVPCESTHIVESKSFKLYLNSFSNTLFAGPDQVRERIRSDISEAVWRGGPVQASVGVRIVLPDQFDMEAVHELDGLSLDRLNIECNRYTPAPELLTAASGEQPVTETLVSNLLKTNCLVTSQPDWGSIQVRYSGPQIDQESLLQYIVSYRNHDEFHEQCVERIFIDLWTRCRPTKLAVYARYTRRGGLDINPFRSSYPAQAPKSIRTARQ